VPQTPGHYRFDVEVFDHNGARVQQAFELHVVAASKGSSAADPPLKDALKLAAPLAKDGVAAGTPPNLSGLVTLLAALPEGEWTQASLNTYASVWTPAELRPLDGQSNPAPDRIILAWSGFTWDPQSRRPAALRRRACQLLGQRRLPLARQHPAMGARVAAEPDQAG
jgi:hypothetical protein